MHEQKQDVRKEDTMFRKTRKAKKSKRNQAINANTILKAVPSHDSNELIETELSIPEDWNISNEDRYVYAFHNNESPKLKVNQISIYGMELTKTGSNGYEVTGLIRNTVQQTIQFQPTVILLLGANQEVIAKKQFDLAELGNIPPNGARPWKFDFSSDDVLKDVEELKEWSLAFELKQEHQLDLEESWEKSIAEEAKLKLQEIVATATPLKPGEVNFMGLSAKQNDNQDLAVTILIRNGSDKNITLEQVPLGVKDASNEEIARGGFRLDNFTVKANTSKP